MRLRVRNWEYRVAESVMKKKQRVSSKFLVLALEPLSSRTEIAYNVGVMRKETPLAKSVFRFFFFTSHQLSIFYNLYLRNMFLILWSALSCFVSKYSFIFLNCLLRLCFFRVCVWSSSSFITIIMNNLSKRINNLVVFLSIFLKKNWKL